MAVRLKKRKTQNSGLSITSLMDVLTIILIFLLVNYSEQMSQANVPDYVSLPSLNTQATLDHNEDIVLAIGASRIELNQKTIEFRSYRHEKSRILQAVETIFREIQAQDTKKGSSRSLTIKADASTDYEIIDDLLLSASSLGITQFDLVALAKDE